MSPRCCCPHSRTISSKGNSTQSSVEAGKPLMLTLALDFYTRAGRIQAGLRWKISEILFLPLLSSLEPPQRCVPVQNIQKDQFLPIWDVTLLRFLEPGTVLGQSYYLSHVHAFWKHKICKHHSDLQSGPSYRTVSASAVQDEPSTSEHAANT